MNKNFKKKKAEREKGRKDGKEKDLKRPKQSQSSRRKEIRVRLEIKELENIKTTITKLKVGSLRDKIYTQKD